MKTNSYFVPATIELVWFDVKNVEYESSRYYATPLCGNVGADA